MDHKTDMSVFVKVVEFSNLTKAGREMRMTPSAVTKRINNLETRLGVRLLNRTTRKISLTEAGVEYFEKSTQILRDINWLESSLSSQNSNPRGILKVTASSLFGRIQLCSLVQEFRQQYEDVHVHLHLTDRHVDLIGEGFDIAIRNSDIGDSNLIVRKLADDRRVICGAPQYFARRGYPKVPADLMMHDCLLLRFPGSRQYRWHFRANEEDISFMMKGPIDSNSSEALHQWTLDGLGLSVRSTSEISDDLKAGRLEAVLTEFSPLSHAYHVVVPQRELLPQKTRVFMDFLYANIERKPHWDNGLGF